MYSRLPGSAPPPTPLPRWKSTMVPSRATAADGVWAHTPSTVSCRVQGPAGVGAVACAIWLFVSHDVKPQPRVISAYSPCHSWSPAPFGNTVIPHVLTFGNLRSPVGPVGCRSSVEQAGPFQAASHTHTLSSEHTPLREQSRSEAQLPAAAAAAAATACVSISTIPIMALAFVTKLLLSFKEYQY